MSQPIRRTVYVIAAMFIIFIFSLATQSQPFSAQQQEPAAPPAGSPAPTLQQRPPSLGQPGEAPAAPQRPRTIFESATVLKTLSHVTVVDVIATTAAGEPVADLKAEDFTIVEDGKPQQIRAFSFQRPNPTAAEPSSVKLPENVFTNVPRINVNSAVNVVLLDGVEGSTPALRDQMLKLLASIPEGQPVAVYVLGTRLRLLQDFTSDHAILRQALNGAATHPAAQDNPNGGPAVELSQRMSGSGLTSDQVAQQMQEFAQERAPAPTDPARYRLDILSALARNLAAYPGRKNLIWIAEGFPLAVNPRVDLQGNMNASPRPSGLATAYTAELMMDAQISIYPVNARALSGPAPAPAAPSTAARGAGRTAAAGTARTEVENARTAMNDLAQATAGRSFYEANEVTGAIPAAITDGSAYYTLAYLSDNNDWDGKFRRIQVKVNREGVKVRHRLGYYAADARKLAAQNQAELEAAFGQALSLDSPAATQLRFEAGIIQPSDKTGNKVLVNFAVDSHALAFDKQPDGSEHAAVDCAVQIYSDKGKPVKNEGSTTDAKLVPDEFRRVMQQNAFLCHESVELPAGTYLFQLGVRDNLTGLIGTTSARMTINAAPAAPAAPK
jgi:VWFA-related protein